MGSIGGPDDWHSGDWLLSLWYNQLPLARECWLTLNMQAGRRVVKVVHPRTGWEQGSATTAGVGMGLESADDGGGLGRRHRGSGGRRGGMRVVVVTNSGWLAVYSDSWTQLKWLRRWKRSGRRKKGKSTDQTRRQGFFQFRRVGSAMKQIFSVSPYLHVDVVYMPKRKLGTLEILRPLTQQNYHSYRSWPTWSFILKRGRPCTQHFESTWWWCKVWWAFLQSFTTCSKVCRCISKSIGRKMGSLG